MPPSPDDMMAAIARNLPAKTGRSWDEWIELARREGPPAHNDRLNWLKAQGLGHSTAFVLTAQSLKPAGYVETTGEELIAAQYAGDKAALRPLYERLAELIQGLGPDVSLEPRQSYVAFSRRRQFALLQPSTKSRLDLGLCLNGTPLGDRLQAAGSFGSGRISHRVGLTPVAEIDAELIGWLQAAYAGG